MDSHRGLVLRRFPRLSSGINALLRFYRFDGITGILPCAQIFSTNLAHHFHASCPAQLTTSYKRQNVQNDIQPLSACLVVLRTMFKKPLSNSRPEKMIFGGLCRILLPGPKTNVSDLFHLAQLHNNAIGRAIAIVELQACMKLRRTSRTDW